MTTTDWYFHRMGNPAVYVEKGVTQQPNGAGLGSGILSGCRENARDMADMQSPLRKLELFFSGATVVSAALLLGYLVLGPASTNAIVLGVGICLLTLVVALGAWDETRARRVAAWPATLLLLVLGFVGIAIGPQILVVAAFAVVASLAMTVRDYH
ncbi:hypothetical protein [Halarchaeum sp. P4]|uniref:hypothetical protein n=1 Tax=Halarchaeum sp. P4 TaxID=3421639 RepID=UPI003EB8A496